jgi:hypothetical protein
MTLIEFLRGAVDALHSHLRDDVRELTPQQLSYRPAPEGNNIAFLLFHLVRIEDQIVSALLKGSPAIWVQEKWHEKLGFDPAVLGIGFTAEQVAALSYPLDEFLRYADRVWKSTNEYLGGLKDEDLAREINAPMIPEVRDVAGLVYGVIIAHGWWHTGEILYLKGLQGWRYRL